MVAWMASLVGGVARADVSAPSTSIPIFEVPEWVDRQISEARTRFEVGAAGTRRSSSLWSPTSTRRVRRSRCRPISGTRATCSSPSGPRSPSKRIFFAELGDIGFDRDLNWKPSKKGDAEKRLEAQRNLYKEFSLPVLFCMGNHDCGRAYGAFFSELRVSSKEYGGMFNGMTKGRGARHRAERGLRLLRCPRKEVPRVLPQHERRRRSRLFRGADAVSGRRFECARRYVRGGHESHMPPPVDREVEQDRPGTIKNGNLCLTILADYVAASKGEEGNVRWDFTGNKGASLAGCISGDKATNNQALTNGVNFVITQGYGTVSAKDLPDGVGYVTPVDRTRTMLVDPVAVKPAKREMKLFRIGAGGPSCDRSFGF